VRNRFHKFAFFKCCNLYRYAEGKLEWNSTTGMWSGACVVRPGVPKAYMSPEKEFVIKSTSKPTDPVSGLVSENFRHLCPATYGNGHANWQADEDSNGNPTGTGQWWGCTS
jgi:hypothetical protein